MSSRSHARRAMSRALAAFTLAAAALAAPLVQAATVSFTGGFTTFTGPVATGPGDLSQSIETRINGTIVHADRPLPGGQFGLDTYGLGVLDEISVRSADAPVQHLTFERIFYSAPSPNHVAFIPSMPLELQPGDNFSVGTFSMINGSWFGNSPGETTFPDTDIGFEVTTHSSDPALDGHRFAGTLRFVVTAAPDGGTAADDADYFYFVERPDLGTMRVYEANDPQGQPQNNIGSIDLRVRIGSLIPVALENATGGAFVGAPAPVPEPATWLALLASLALLGAVRARR